MIKRDLGIYVWPYVINHFEKIFLNQRLNKHVLFACICVMILIREEANYPHINMGEKVLSGGRSMHILYILTYI